jgi:hypothetical protein
VNRSDTCWVDVEILRQSASGLAWLVRGGNDREAWIPNAAIVDTEDDLAPGVHTKIEVPTSMAEEKELV